MMSITFQTRHLRERERERVNPRGRESQEVAWTACQAFSQAGLDPPVIISFKVSSLSAIKCLNESSIESSLSSQTLTIWGRKREGNLLEGETDIQGVAWTACQALSQTGLDPPVRHLSQGIFPVKSMCLTKCLLEFSLSPHTLTSQPRGFRQARIVVKYERMQLPTRHRICLWEAPVILTQATETHCQVEIWEDVWISLACSQGSSRTEKREWVKG